MTLMSSGGWLTICPAAIGEHYVKHHLFAIPFDACKGQHAALFEKDSVRCNIQFKKVEQRDMM